MRPVNLIPPEQRRGERPPLRTGAASYGVVALLGVAVAAVTMLVLTGNQISERKAEKASLEAEQAELTQRSKELAPYAEFASMQQARRATVSSLAESRFDWERVLDELAITIPSDVWLVQLTGTVSPTVQLENGVGISVRSQVPGPALEMMGCAANQDSVARFAAALKDIDGVTRVAVAESKRPDPQSATDASADSAAPTGGSTDGAECRTRDHIARFAIVAAFDAVPAPASATTTPPAPGTTVPPADTTSTTTTPASDDGGVADTQGQEQAARDSAADQTQKAEKAGDFVTGAVR
jgi:Tfp pilus assembly protein PilN